MVTTTEKAGPRVSAFETETCTRCGGSGRYSFNLIDLDLCYGCFGSGKNFTKRGLAAKNFHNALCSIPAEQVEAGMVIYYDGKKRRVTEVGPSKSRHWESGVNDWIPMLEIKTEIGNLIVSRNSSVRVVQADPVERNAKIAQALEFQASLTKEGKPRKRAQR